MMIYFLELPGWHFEASEVSAGVYRITGVRGGEKRVERTGHDTTELLEQCHRDALEVVQAEGGGRRAEV